MFLGCGAGSPESCVRACRPLRPVCARLSLSRSELTCYIDPDEIGLKIGLDSMPRKRLSTADATERLRSYLMRQPYGPQDRLEPERALAPRIGCSRETLRAVLDVLEKEGLIWRHVGQGTFMGPRPAYEPIRPSVLAEMASPADVLQARLQIEPPIAGAAALLATVDDIALLRRLAFRSSEAPDWQAYEPVDDAFHKGIARASGNPLLIAFLDVLSSVRGRARWQRQQDLAFRRARKQEYAAQHGRMHIAIVDAIAARNPEAARQAMFDHLSAVRAVMLHDALLLG
jgi:GntR family transcriptional regulator, transcriptional repressor for pyruvate dehydrogenase complex